MGLSPLRSHISAHKFDDTPSDKCNCQINTVEFALILSILEWYFLLQFISRFSLVNDSQNVSGLISAPTLSYFIFLLCELMWRDYLSIALVSCRVL